MSKDFVSLEKDFMYELIGGLCLSITKDDIYRPYIILIENM